MKWNRALLFVAGLGAWEIAAALQLEVVVHYPHQDSVVDKCGFALKVSTPYLNEETPPAAERVGPNTFVAGLDLPDDLIHTQVSLAVMGNLSNLTMIGNTECQALCPRLDPQGMVVMEGPYVLTEPLQPQSRMEIWPSFCSDAHGWGGKNVTFHSGAIGRKVHIVARLPAAVIENPLPRPAHLLPPVMFRFNSEWYWPEPGTEYTVWHDLMINGMMEPFVVAEIYIQGVNYTDWFTQPIFALQKPTKNCKCSPETQFICDAWHKTGYLTYARKPSDHYWGAAPAFFDELYEQALPGVMAGLPRWTGASASLRVGAWGYCIGGLAAWNAITSRPERFNIGYLGSPALDFDCGAPLASVQNISWTAEGRRPKVYIDAGAAEGPLMDQQTLILMQRLQARGAVEGTDIFYERMQFGTHQGRSLLRRALRALMVLFGTKEGGAVAYTPVLQILPQKEPPVPQKEHPVSEPLSPTLLATILVVLLAAVGCFSVVSAILAPYCRQWPSPEAKEPFLRSSDDRACGA